MQFGPSHTGAGTLGAGATDWAKPTPEKTIPVTTRNMSNTAVAIHTQRARSPGLHVHATRTRMNQAPTMPRRISTTSGASAASP